MKRFFCCCGCVVVIIFVFWFMFPVHEESKKVSSEKNDVDVATPVLHGLYDAVRVVDGDTIVVLIDKQETTIRLIGVDTPESVASEDYFKENSEEGKTASLWLKDLLKNKSVFLEYDVGKTDNYGRVLAYVYLEDGVSMINRILLQNGLAKLMTIQPNIKYESLFIQDQTRAKEEKKGFWADYFN